MDLGTWVFSPGKPVRLGPESVPEIVSSQLCAQLSPPRGLQVQEVSACATTGSAMLLQGLASPPPPKDPVWFRIILTPDRNCDLRKLCAPFLVSSLTPWLQTASWIQPLFWRSPLAILPLIHATLLLPHDWSSDLHVSTFYSPSSSISPSMSTWKC